MSKCEVCNREKAPPNYRFPKDVRYEENYCACIPWQTMEKRIILSLFNAERIIDDAEFLLKNNRLSSSELLTISALEETGKPCLG